MKILTLDVETTTHQKGNPFSLRNKLCMVGIKEYENPVCSTFDIEQSGLPYADALRDIQRSIESADLLVGFNIKFDLNWIRRYVPNIKFPRVWDCQLCHFIDMAQSTPYPSLDSVLAYYGMEPKLDVVRTQYWDNGIDTTDVPISTLTEYLQGDLARTESVFRKQYENQEQRALKELHFNDLLFLSDCEYNGIPIDFQEMDQRAKSLLLQIELLENKVKDFLNVKDRPDINIHSPEQISILLYGGRMYREELRSYTKVLKGGPVLREKKEWVYEVFPPRIKANKSAELAATKGKSDSELNHINSERITKRLKPIQRLFSCEESVLKATLARGKTGSFIQDYIQLKELLKIQGTYYEGLRKQANEYEWGPNRVHPNYNQCVVATGRLSSTKPNAQNFPAEIRDLVYSRDGYSIVEADAKALEWLCVASLANDQTALEEIKAGVDIHEVNRVAFGLPDRLTAKVFVFRLIYGGSAFSYAKDPDFFRVSKKEEFWQGVIDKFYEKYRGIHRWHKELVNAVVKSGGTWSSPTGRKYIFDLSGGRNIPRTKILNYPVQGFAADIMAGVRVALQRGLSSLPRSSYYLIGTVHDSILVEAKETEVSTVKACIESAFSELLAQFRHSFQFELPVQFTVKVKAGKCWGNLKEI